MRSETSPSSSSRAAPRERCLVLEETSCGATSVITRPGGSMDRSLGRLIAPSLDADSLQGSSSCFPSGHFSAAADGAGSCGRDGVLAVGAGRGHGGDHLDPPLHGRRLRLHRHGDGPPRAAGGPLQLWPVCDGDPGSAVRSRHDGGDRGVRVRREAGRRTGSGGLKCSSACEGCVLIGARGLCVFSCSWSPL